MAPPGEAGGVLRAVGVLSVEGAGAGAGVMLAGGAVVAEGSAGAGADALWVPL